eukprot:2665212-Pyramimonas_sp.AAC.1
MAGAMTSPQISWRLLLFPSVQGPPRAAHVRHDLRSPLLDAPLLAAPSDFAPRAAPLASSHEKAQGWAETRSSRPSSSARGSW